MVNREARDILIELTRRLFCGRINSRAYEDLCWRHIDFSGEDQGLWHTHLRVVFHWIDDPFPRMMSFRGLSRMDREEIVRCILFLQSDREFEWDESGMTFVQMLGVILYLVSFGKRGQAIPKKKRGDRRVYPFFRQADIDVAIAMPRLLAG